MQKMMLKNYILFLTKIPVVLFALMLLASGCKKLSQLKGFEQVNLVANTSGYGAVTVDPTLVNGWGLAFGSSGIAWVSSQGNGLSEVYNAAGAIARPAVTIPSPTSAAGGSPTGAVFSSSATDFKLSNGNPARFIFAGTDGIISGWNTGNAAELMLNDAADAAYTGLALASDGAANFLYAANFREKKIDVYDNSWNEVERAFTDPAMPAGYSPFNVQNIGGKLYVLYAKVGPNGRDEAGMGKGFVNVYNPDGSFVRRFASGGALNAPWGIAQAPAGFWNNDSATISHGTPRAVILVGNFGNGHINAYSENGIFLGELRRHARPIVIDGLWAISFAPATATAVNPEWLFFAAGPNEEKDGLFGYISKEN